MRVPSLSGTWWFVFALPALANDIVLFVASAIDTCSSVYRLALPKIHFLVVTVALGVYYLLLDNR